MKGYQQPSSLTPTDRPLCKLKQPHALLPGDRSLTAKRGHIKYRLGKDFASLC